MTIRAINEAVKHICPAQEELDRLSLAHVHVYEELGLPITNELRAQLIYVSENSNLWTEKFKELHKYRETFIEVLYASGFSKSAANALAYGCKNL